MKAKYPEITSFFEKRLFSDFDLQTLVEKLKIKYSDRSEFSMAKAIIDLELLKYRLQSEEDSCEIGRKTKFENKSSIKPVKKQKCNPFEERNKKCREEVDNLITEDLYTISKQLNVSLSFLRRLCNTDKDYVLDDQPEFERLRSFMESKIQLLYRQKVKEELSNKVVVKKKKKGYSRKENVFQLMNDFGLRGKIIYIRKS